MHGARNCFLNCTRIHVLTYTFNYALVYPTYVYLWELAQLLHVQSNIIIVMQQDAAVRCPSESSPVFSIDVLAGP